MALRTGSNENTNLINKVKELPLPANFITSSTTTHPPSPSYKHETDGKKEKKRKDITRQLLERKRGGGGGKREKAEGTGWITMLLDDAAINLLRVE